MYSDVHALASNPNSATELFYRDHAIAAWMTGFKALFVFISFLYQLGFLL
jgi:hypothetical protein